jgi:hypothetical protein
MIISIGITSILKIASAMKSAAEKWLATAVSGRAIDIDVFSVTTRKKMWSAA